MSWIIKDKGFMKENTELNGNKFLLGNGYMGYRGTMEEYERNQLVACNLLGLYDKVGDKWREPVNAPNGLYTRLNCDGAALDIRSCEPAEHEQSLDMRRGIHKRTTVFNAPGDNRVTVISERFLSLLDVHLICMKYTLQTLKKCKITVETGIDGDVWDINGPHLRDLRYTTEGDLIVLDSKSSELGCPVSVAESIDLSFECGKMIKAEDKITMLEDQSIRTGDKKIIRKITLKVRPEEVYALYKYVSVYTGNDGVGDVSLSSRVSCLKAGSKGYEALLAENTERWNERWERSDVRIIGDDTAQLALRYSVYHLLSIAPTHSDRMSIPARGLSGQVYKGAIFWDTEMFMLPFFLYTDPSTAKNLIRYRIHTLDGARRKAAEYGYKGAYYAWESQDTGDDACTHFSVTDVFTGRPVRTYFRDKQIHINCDVVYGIWQYYEHTGDESILFEGGAEVILECARFLFSYTYFKKEKNRYEILDVTGPDEYHERVNNNAFTNMIARYTLEVAENTLEFLKNTKEAYYHELIKRLNCATELDGIREMREMLYIPQPDSDTLVIEQFDGYHRLEDLSLKELKGRMLDPKEYLGGGCGLASTTKILKQADTVLMLNLFKSRYPYEVKKANWEYYEPRTEHGSSLSPCVYALLAADIGNLEWAFRFFMKTAMIDLTGDSKQYAGTIYIGGTHPAANGGAWMAAVSGFAGIGASGETMVIKPQLPDKWESIAFRIVFRGQSFSVKAGKAGVRVKASGKNSKSVQFNICGQLKECRPRQEIQVQGI